MSLPCLRQKVQDFKLGLLKRRQIGGLCHCWLNSIASFGLYDAHLFGYSSIHLQLQKCTWRADVWWKWAFLALNDISRFLLSRFLCFFWATNWNGKGFPFCLRIWKKAQKARMKKKLVLEARIFGFLHLFPPPPSFLAFYPPGHDIDIAVAINALANLPLKIVENFEVDDWATDDCVYK